MGSLTDAGNQRIERRRILVVDDYELNREIIQAMLVRLGQEVVLVDSGEGALEMLGDEPFDLVLMDVHMPDLDGMETTRRIRNLAGEAGRVAVYALSASDLEAERHKCIEAGMDGFLSKPIDLPRVEGFLRSLPPVGTVR
ncbi:MAG: response regulator [Fibrobacteria bacterium]|nr:response regulator [Fibrobacteria bacterium]